MKIAYTILEAAEATGHSESVIKRAIRKGDLVPRYPTSKPVIPKDELDDWIKTSPTTPPKRTSEAAP